MANESTNTTNEDVKSSDQSADAFKQIEPLSDDERSDLLERSSQYIGRWNTLISTTNWEKGQIIAQWQKSLEESELDEHVYSDQRWSEIVGGVTPQHVGRLRRTFARFGHVYQEYEGLYWSHFYAALDWDDAEMWLEGAVQNEWSISGMRKQRWETMGADPAEKPKVDHIVVSEAEEEEQQAVSAFDREYTEGPRPDGPDFGDEEDSSSSSDRDVQTSDALDSSLQPTGPKVRPFESFTNLPDDIASAAAEFKVAIIRHKTDEWSEISIDELMDLLDALKQLAGAASE